MTPKDRLPALIFVTVSYAGVLLIMFLNWLGVIGWGRLSYEHTPKIRK